MDLSISTWLFTAVIIVAFFIAWIWLVKQHKSGELSQKRRWAEQLPSFISTLGVLGTFCGITDGLLAFDSNNLDQSIPALLDGLKTAFFTSLAGMIGSLILSRIVARYYDEQDKGISDITQAASQITNAVKDMAEAIIQNTKQQSQMQSAFYNNVNSVLSSLQSTLQQQAGDISQILTFQANQSTNIQAISDKTNLIVEGTKLLGTQQETIVNKISEVDNKLSDFEKQFTSIDQNVGETVSMVEGITSIQNEISEEVKSFGDKLHNEVVEIEDSMEKTNTLLNEKFNEFSELLKKSNTEALVEVMKKVTEEFQKQMNELIGRLVQENFEQLNKSVEKLNTWQQENKEMITSLTAQYKQMQEEFAKTSTILTSVSEETKQLTASEGKLQTLIKALNKVMVEDKHFVEMTNNLTSAAELNKNSMTEFKDAQSALNDWVRKQRNFVDSVVLLMNKLDEIAKIKDYSDEFWKGTKQGMEGAVSTIQKGVTTLNQQIGEIDAHFYERLQTTLENLDACITAMANDRPY